MTPPDESTAAAAPTARARRRTSAAAASRRPASGSDPGASIPPAVGRQRSARHQRPRVASRPASRWLPRAVRRTASGSACLALVAGLALISLVCGDPRAAADQRKTTPVVQGAGSHRQGLRRARCPGDTRRPLARPDHPPNHPWSAHEPAPRTRVRPDPGPGEWRWPGAASSPRSRTSSSSGQLQGPVGGDHRRRRRRLRHRYRRDHAGRHLDGQHERHHPGRDVRVVRDDLGQLARPAARHGHRQLGQHRCGRCARSGPGDHHRHRLQEQDHPHQAARAAHGRRRAAGQLQDRYDEVLDEPQAGQRLLASTPSPSTTSTTRPTPRGPATPQRTTASSSSAAPAPTRSAPARRAPSCAGCTCPTCPPA